MSEGSDLAAPGARALVIATGEHQDSRLPPVPSAVRSARALAERLVGVCGMSADRVRVLLDPPTALDIARAVSEEAAIATTTLLVHYVGHGLRGPGGELYLAASGTDELTPGLAAHQAYPFADLRQAVTSARASSLVVLLDCCFSNRARGGALALSGAFDSPPVHGFYLLGSAEQLALAPADAEHTTFTGALINLLDKGDPRRGPVLTLDDAYDRLFQDMRARHAPLPRRQEGGRAGHLVVAPNAAFQPVPAGDAEPVEQSPGRSPYLGLAAFAEDDARFFHGREDASAELFDAVRASVDDRGLVLVVGASGSGKSSLVQAGLMPRVRQSLGRSCVTFTPGERPLHRLAAALGVADGTAVDDALADPAGAATWPSEGDRPLLVAVDQLEELVTLCADEGERAAFASALAAVADSGRAVVVGVLRADFYAQATRYPEFAEALRERQFLVEPMDRAQLRAAVEGPAEAGGLLLDEALADLVLTELGATRRQGPEPGALPLLSHAMWATWRRRRGDRLTVQAYREVGGIAGAIAKSADDTVDALDEPARDAVRRMMPRLVRVGEDSADTARPVDRADLVRGLPVDAADTALRALADARLITTDREVVRISHEALLVSWPALAEWVDADRRWLATAQRLAADAHTWSAARVRDPSLLYRGGRLAAVLDEAPDRGELDETSAAFLDASRAQERRGVLVRRGVVASLAVLLVASLVGGVVAVVQAGEAARQARAAHARNLISTADAVRDTDPRLALQLGVAAHRLAPDAASNAALIETLTASRYRGALSDRSSPVSALALSPDGRTLAVGVREGVRLWDFRDPGKPVPRGEPTGGFDGPVTALAWHPTGTRLVAGDSTALRVLDVRTDGTLADVGSLPGFGSPVSTAAWSADGAVLLAANDSITVVLVVTDDGYQVASTLRRAAGGSTRAQPRPVLSGKGDFMVVPTDDGGAQVWSLADPRAPRAVGPPLNAGTAPFSAMALSSDDRVLATGTLDSRVVLWDLAGGPRRIANPKQPADIAAPVVRLAFAQDDRTLVIADLRGAVALMRFPVETPLVEQVVLGETEPAFAAHTGQLDDLVVTRDLLITGGDDGETRLWQLGDGDVRPTRLGTPLAGHESGSTAGTIEVAERVATSTATDGALLVWDVDGRGGFTPRPPVRFGESFGRSALSPWGRTVATPGSASTGIRLWDIPAGGAAPVPVGEEFAGQLTVADFAWTPDGQVLVAGGQDGVVVVHDVTDRAAPRELARFTVAGRVAHVHVAGDRSLTAVSTIDGVVELWDLSTPERPQRLGTASSGQSGNDRGASALSDDGTLLAIGQFSGIVRLYSLADPRAPQQLASWRAPGVGLVGALDFSPDGDLLAVGTLQSTQVWDISDRGQPRQLGVPLFGRNPMSLAFVPGRHVLAAQTAVQVELWELSALATLRGDVVGPACHRLGGQGLSPVDWARLVPGQEYRDTCA